MNNLKQLSNLLANILDRDELSLSTEDTLNTIEGWDSLVSVQLMTAVMNTYQIELSFEDIEKFYSIKGILSILEKEKV